MKHPGLVKIVKTAEADVQQNDCERWRVPAEYAVTGPTGRVYHVEGTGYARMERSRWSYSSELGDSALYKGGFSTMRACLDAIAKLEAEASTKNTFAGEAA